MANEKNLVKHSLHKFLDDGLDTFVTYDSNQSDLQKVLENVTIQSGTTLTSGTTSFVIYEGGIAVTGITASQLIGQTIKVANPTFDSDVITGYDPLTSTVTIQNGFDNDVTEFDTMSVEQESMIYMIGRHGIEDRKSKYKNLRKMQRYDLIIKIRDDSNRDKIYGIIQNIETLIFSNNANFNIYDETLISILGYGKIRNFENEDQIDTNNDMQSYLVTFLVDYWVEY